MNGNRYCYSLFCPDKHYGMEPNFLHTDKLPTEGFASLYNVTEETAQALHEAGTTKGFKGIVWAERLWIDIDSYPAAEQAEATLRAMELDFIAFDSGGKGAHFGVMRTNAPSHLLPAMDKAWVREHLPQADLSVYTHLHPFRLPGTMHEKTGRPKELVVQVSGQSLRLPPYKEPNRRLSLSSASLSNSVFDCFMVMANSVPASVGTRHEQLVKLVYALKDDAKLPIETALWWALEVNKRFSEPKSYEEIEKIVLSLYEV